MFRPRILDRYIFVEMLPTFFLSMAVLLFVLLLEKLFRLADLVVSKGATLASTAEVLAYVVPGFLVIAIPMSLTVASLTAFARLSSDSEITAMKASRISLYSMIRPVFLFALLAFLFTAFTSLILVPGANSALKTRLFALVKSRALIGIEPGIFSNSFEGMVVYVDKMDSDNNLEGVFISDERSAREPYAIVARSGKLIADQQAMNVTLAMDIGTILTQPRVGQSYSLMGFDKARLNLDISNSLQKNSPGKSVDDFNSFELLNEIKRLRNEGKPSYTYETELHKRLSIPFACIILGLIGAPLGIRRSRSGKSAGVAIALLIFLVYFIILSGATNLAETGTFPAYLAFWIPNVLMTLAALLFILKRGREINLGLGNRVSMLYYGMKARLKRRA
ncbi:MAG: LPS export ABC transporter permease LptF [Nitrospirota bacterium]